MKEQLNRSEFIQHYGRNGLLLGTIGLAAAALHGSRSPEECINTGVCGSCTVHNACTLPEREELD